VKLARLEVLSDEDIRKIHEATLDILENCGVQIDCPQMLSFLREKGLPVDAEKRTVRMSRSCVEDAVRKVPSQFEVYDREGRPAFILGDGVSRITAGHNAVFWVDSETGRTRRSTVADVELFARICDELECMDMIGIPVMPQDVPVPRATLLRGVDAVVRNSTKPIFFSTDNMAVNRAVIDMLAAAYAGDFQAQAYGISQLSPTAPLSWEKGVLEAIMDTVTTAVPLAILPEPNAGVSSPYTLAGLLTVNNAECLSAFVMIQLLKPGFRTMYANSWTATDMRTGAALVGSTETSICRVAGAQLARFYDVPSHTTAPNSDNHAHDEQNAWEKTFSTFCSVAASNHLIVNCGMFATGMTCSNEQLIMDEEISAMSKRIAAGIKVDDETIARDLIKEIGPRGNYLTTDHTLRWLRSDEYLTPRVSVRGPRAAWEEAGSPDTYMLARNKVREYGKSAGSPLDSDRAARMAEIMTSFEKET
jgi:trimethylamine--corrinoid protein Co-methyltransferase